MTQKEKQLLLKDLCMRIQCRTFVYLNPGAYNKPETCILTGIDGDQIYLNVDSDPFGINNIRPYLRPMSSMTKGEGEEYELLIDCSDYTYFKTSDKVIDWLNEHHFDFRGLIEKGLALEAPEDMYKEK